MQYKNSQKTSFLMRKAKKKFSCCYEDFYSEKLAENLYSTQKNGLFFSLASHARNLEFCLASRKT